MYFVDVAKDLSEAYPQAGLLVASTPHTDGASPCLQVLVLSQLGGKAIAIAAVESESSLEAAPQARWYWFSILGLPLDVFVPAGRLDDARRLAGEACVHIRGLFPYTPGPTSPVAARVQRPGATARPVVTGAVKVAGVLVPAST